MVPFVCCLNWNLNWWVNISSNHFVNSFNFFFWTDGFKLCSHRRTEKEKGSPKKKIESPKSTSKRGKQIARENYFTFLDSYAKLCSQGWTAIIHDLKNNKHAVVENLTDADAEDWWGLSSWSSQSS